MLKRFSIVLVGILLAAAFCYFNSSNVYAVGEETYRLIRVDISGKEDITRILSTGGLSECAPDINLEEGYLELQVNGDELRSIEELGYNYIVIIPDLEAYYAAQYNGETMGGFLTYSELNDAMDSLVDAYPNYIMMSQIGSSHYDSAIFAIKVSDNVQQQEDEPEVLITGLTHAREPIGGAICIDFAEWLMDNYGSDPQATEIVNERQVWIVPCVNPDGYLYNQQTNPGGGGMWRKNRRNNGGSYGVDNNRNYTYMWGYNNQGSSPDPSSQTYRGPWAGSEPENQAIMEFCQAHNFVFAIHYHSGSTAVLHAYGYDNGAFTPEQDYYHTVAESLATFTGYDDVGCTWQIMYQSNGNAYDYSYGEQVTKNKIFGFVPESGPFWPSVGQIPGLVNSHRNYNITVSMLADNPFRAIAPIAPVIDEMTTDPDGNFTVSWDIVVGDPEPDRFELQEVSGSQIITDGAETGTDNWVFNRFSRSASRSHSGTYSYFSGAANNLHSTMTLKSPVPVQAGDDLTFYIYYDIEYNYDFGYVEVSADGYNFDILETFSGSGASWRLKTYDLDDYAGHQVYVRFRYETDVGLTDPGFWVDDIHPIRTFSTVTTIDDNITGFSYDITGKDPGIYNYRVRAENVQGWGIYGNVEDIEVTGSGPDLTVEFEPVNPPINVTRGGHFRYIAMVTNGENNAQTADCWIGLRIPDGRPYGPLDIFYDVPFGANSTRTFSNLRQVVPGYAPLGDYLYIGYIGEYPSTIYDSSYFDFTVIAGEGDGSAGTWAVYGWPGSEKENAGTIPTVTGLNGNYPNPFNATTRISFDMAEAGNVNLKIYNITGQLIETLADGHVEAGRHSIEWDASGYSSGLYFYRLTAGENVFTRRMTLLK